MTQENWPDKIRLEMIERSGFYREPQIYQYGYYDGYQKGISQPVEQQDIPMGKIAQAFIDAYKEFNPNMKESHEDILNRIATRAAKNILSMFPQSPKEDIPMEKEHSVQTLKVEKDIANAANSCYLRINSYANPSTMNGIEREWIIKMIEITLTEQKEKWTASQPPKEK